MRAALGRGFAVGLFFVAISCSSRRIGSSAKAIKDSPNADAVVSVVKSKFTKTIVHRRKHTVNRPPDPVTNVPELVPSAADSFTQSGDAIAPHILTPATRSSTVRLPQTINKPLTLIDDLTGFNISRLPLGIATGSAAETSGGYLVFRDATGTSALIERPTGDGVEDLFYLTAPPQGSHISYSVALGPLAAGLRLTSNVLEFLDSQGTPRMRLTGIVVIDVNGVRRTGTLSVSGCAIDTSSNPPWGRPVTPPRSMNCTVNVSWSSAGLTYPVLVDPSWTNTADMPVRRVYHSAVPWRGYVVVLGGIVSDNSPTTSTEVDAYDASTQTWSPIAALNEGRDPGAAVGLLPGGDILIAGGNSDLGNDPSTSSERLTLVAGNYQWVYSSSALSAPNGRMYGAMAVASSGTAYFCGGYEQSDYTILSSCDSFSPVTNSWSAIHAMSTARESLLLAALDDGRIVAISGDDGPEALNTAEKYSPSSNSWTATAPMTDAHEGGSAVIRNGTLTVIGGGGYGYISQLAESYNAASNNWSSVTFNTRGQAYAVAALLPNNAILSATGDDEDPINGTEYSRVVNLLDDSGWHQIQNVNYAREGAAGAVIPGSHPTTFLLTGGQNQSFITWNNDMLTTKTESLTLSANGATCTIAGLCDSGNCLGGICAVPQGGSCNASADCQSGHCVQGVCCDSACGGDCNACAVAWGAAQDGVCATVKDRVCGGTYVCNGTSANCPTSCSSGANCSEAAACTNGTCQCAFGYCAQTQTCKASSSECCTNTDCTSPPDTCHSTTGATCQDGICLYPSTQCSSGQSCQVGQGGGTCVASPLTLTVTPSSATYVNGTNIFKDGTIHFTATLTNVSQSPIVVSAYAIGNISIVSLSKDGVTVPPASAGEYASVFDQTGLADLSLITLQPQGSTSFRVPAVSAYLPLDRSFTNLVQYTNSGTGSYSVVFEYRYAGLSSSCYHGTVRSAAVPFGVQ